MAQHLALVAIGLAGTFVAIGVSIVATISKPRMRYAYIFFALAIVMIVFFWLGWHIAPSLPPQEAASSETTGQNSGNWPFVLAGIGTLALAAIAFVEMMIPRWNKPKLSFEEFTNSTPFCRKTDSNIVVGDPRSVGEPNTGSGERPSLAQVAPTYWIRLGVKNTGRSVAKRCVGKLERVLNASRVELKDYDPMILNWVGTSHFDIPLKTIDLNRGQHEYLDFVSIRKEIPYAARICTDIVERGTRKSFPAGEYIVEMTIYGDDVEPVTKKYRLVWKADDYEHIEMEQL